MEKFTVIGFYEESGQTVCHHIEAEDGTHAFYVVAQEHPSLTMVVAAPGHLKEGPGELTFPGAGLVSAETILEQTEVFGGKAAKPKPIPKSKSSLSM